MIRLDNVAKHFGGRTLFSGVNWTLPPGKRVGLVGPNGAGKTTLFRMLSGEMATDEGAIHRAKGTSLGLLAQDVGHIGDASLIDFVLEGRPDLMALERKMDALTERAHAAVGPEAAALGEELAHVTDAFERAGGYRFRSDGQSILLGMGFKPHELERAATELSGGWRVRLVLSKLLLQRPDFLLMDEPTNHLDVPSVEWLEGFLAHYEGTVVVISHDRYFLNRLVNQIAAIEPQGIYVQDGNYDDYVNAWAERAEQLEKLKTRQDREIKELERFVERFRAKATKAKQAQSRAKRLEKIDRIQTLSTKKVVRGFSFAEGPRSGRIVVEAKALGCRFGDHVVYDNLDLSVERGARVAIVGPNGAGKSTLLRLIAEELVPNAGSVELGHNVMMSYFGQHQVELLDHSRTVLEEMEACAPVDEVPRCRSILGSFLFTGDDVQKKISVLSGGERNRLALAKLLLHPTNFLLLDEPTNHLDMDSRDVLLEALDAFDGTLMVVSHDRHFINEIATQVVHIEDERALHYDGDFEYYHEKHAERVASAGESQEPRVEQAAQSAHSKKDQRRAEAERRAQLKKLLGDKPKRAAALEADIERLEAEVTRLETALADPGFYDGATPDEIADAGRALDATRATLESTMDEWAETTEEIERIEAEELE